MGLEFLLIVLLVAALLFWLLRTPAGRGRQGIRVAGEWRTYAIDRPRRTAGAKPLLLCFHGGLARVDRLRRQSGITEAALSRGFTVVFPEAPGGWIDARPERGSSRRDLAFIDALLDRLERTEGELGPVFALGVSNGGMFVLRLAMEQPQRFAGFATLLASIPVAAARNRPAGPPKPIVMVYGRDDPLMPYAGGRIPQGRRPGMGVGGLVIPAEATLQYWLQRNRSRREPSVRHTGGEDGPVEIRDYPPSPEGAPVRFVSIADWGHQWPRWPGEKDGIGGFDIADVIFEFFVAQSSGEALGAAEPVRLRLGEA